MSTETSDTTLAAVSRNATGRLATLNRAGILDGSDCIVTARVCGTVGEGIESDAALALAFTVRAVREGSTALDLADVTTISTADETADEAADEDGGDLGEGDLGEIDSLDPATVADLVELPEIQAWRGALATSPLVRDQVLHLDLDLVYLDRYLLDERRIAAALTERDPAQLPPVDPVAVDADLAGSELNDEQQAAVRSVATRPVTVLTGGPGMGKTHAIGQVLRTMARASGGALRIGLAAPTGKAAARMNEALGALTDDGTVRPAVTLHRLLGPLPGTNLRFKHGNGNPLPYDLVVVDEASMVSLNLMARLCEALPATARLLLVGDPDQLASVEAGSVLADVVAGLADSGAVVRLVRDYRMGDDRALLAAAFRSGEPARVRAVIAEASTGVRLIETDAPTMDDLPQVLDHALALREAAARGDLTGALDRLGRLRLLCAHRDGPHGATHWNRLVEQELAKHVPDVRPNSMYIGRPLLVTRNDHGLGLNNGDAGVVVHTPDGLRAVIETGRGPELHPPWRLSDVETMHAMTVHKAQGSQADEIVVIVPPIESKLLTRELVYTAVTRPQRQLTLVGSMAAVEQAVATPARRTSGLRQRLHG